MRVGLGVPSEDDLGASRRRGEWSRFWRQCQERR
jgi:hypothetical protein